MSKSIREIKDTFEAFDVVAFLEQHNIKYDEWLKSQIFQLIHAIEKDVVKVFEGCVCVPQQKLQELVDEFPIFVKGERDEERYSGFFQSPDETEEAIKVLLAWKKKFVELTEQREK